MLCFPSSEDVRLKNAPLAEVICQVRFPPVLRIGSEQPADFQERIRGRFPQLGVEQGMVVRMAPLEGEPPWPSRSHAPSGSSHPMDKR